VHKKKLFALLSVLACALAVYLVLPESCPEAARRTAFVFVLAGLFWALELIPLYATSLITVLLLIFFLCRPGGILGMDQSGYTMFLVPFSSPIIMLFFGGFVLSEAMHKYHVDRLITNRMLRYFRSSPYSILLGFMASTAFLSMWLSNTATTAMMIAMVGPLLKDLDADDPLRKSLALGIAFSANIGGIGTPVGTPPNAIALGILREHDIFLTFLGWMRMAIPLVVILLFAASGILYFLFRPKHTQVRLLLRTEKPLDNKGKLAAWIALFTVAMWLTAGWHHIPVAVTGLLAAGLLGGMHLLDRDDLKRIDWDVLVLMWGGLALGKGIEVSGLAHWLLGLPLFDQQGFVLVGTFCVLAATLSMFISNTAAANLIVPLAVSIPGENVVVLAIVVALSCSFGMVLPISTPPNALAFSSKAFSSREMAKAGLLICVSAITLLLLGYKFVLGSIR
jgi:solute carrier family 13 (sodium-dependent dicarboxylate transporter), member 2/3/5